MRICTVIPTRNRPHLLERAVESVFRQTRPSDEVIVVPNDERDPAIAWCRSRHPDRLRVVVADQPGAAHARNAGWRSTYAEWIAFLDDDDAWLPHRLERQTKTLDLNPDAAAVFADAWIGFEGGTARRTVMTRQPPSAGHIFQALLSDNFIPVSTVLVRRERLEAMGGFRQDMAPAEDYDAWLRMAADGVFALEPEPLAVYGVHEGQLSRHGARMLAASARAVEAAAESRPTDPARIRRRRWQLHAAASRAYARIGDRKEARRHARLCVSIAWWKPGPWPMACGIV